MFKHPQTNLNYFKILFFFYLSSGFFKMTFSTIDYTKLIKPLLIFSRHEESVTAVTSWREDSGSQDRPTLVASGDVAGRVLIWRLSSGRLQGELPKFQSQILWLGALCLPEPNVYVQTRDGHLYAYRMNCNHSNDRYSPQLVFKLECNSMTFCTFDCIRMYSNLDRGILLTIDRAHKHRLNVHLHCGDSITTALFLDQPHSFGTIQAVRIRRFQSKIAELANQLCLILAIAFEDGHIRIVRLRSNGPGEKLQLYGDWVTLENGGEFMTSIECVEKNDELRVLCAGAGNHVKCFILSESSTQFELQRSFSRAFIVCPAVPKAGLASLSLRSDNGRLAGGGWDGWIRIFETDRLMECEVFTYHASRTISRVHFVEELSNLGSANSQHLLAATNQGLVSVWRTI